MNKKISLGAAVAFSAVVAAIVFTLTMVFSQDVFNAMISNDSQRAELYDKIEKIDTLADTHFLYPVDEQEVVDMVGKGYVAGLNDQYAAYFSKEEYENKIQDDEGELVGIGITISETSDGYMEILTIRKGSPSESAGLKEGDLVIKVNGEDVVAIGVSKAIENIKGEEGTKVKLTIRRDSKDTEYEMARKKMDVISVESRMIEQNAYIKITDFNEATVKQFENAIEEAQDNGAKGLIFDLRNNGGGTLSSVCDMLDMLVGEGTIVTQTTANGETTTIAKSDKNEINMPMICLTNGSTASASELFVSVLKDYEKAESVGTTSFGKGVMQTTYPLKDGSAVKMTTAYFNPPISENFNGVGIKPEYEVVLTSEQETNFDTLDETTDPQLMKAIEVVSSK